MINNSRKKYKYCITAFWGGKGLGRNHQFMLGGENTFMNNCNINLIISYVYKNTMTKNKTKQEKNKKIFVKH